MMNRLPLRWRQMLLGWGSVGVVYHITPLLQGEGQVLMPSLIDRLIPFHAGAIWLYLSFFLLIPLAYLLSAKERVVWLARSMQFGALCAGVFYLLWPTTLNYPAIIGDDLSSRMLRHLAGFDTPQNCLPSLHALLTTLSVWALCSRPQHYGWRVVWLWWGIAIGISVIQLRRHLFIDVVAGVALAVLIGMLCQRHQRSVCQQTLGSE